MLKKNRHLVLYIAILKKYDVTSLSMIPVVYIYQGYTDVCQQCLTLIYGVILPLTKTPHVSGTNWVPNTCIYE